MHFLEEPVAHSKNSSGIAVVLVNLGSPDAPTPRAVRRYLKEFLSDPRVVEIPRALWWFILRGMILPFRARSSARKYASVWHTGGEGAPLKIHTRAQAHALGERLKAKGHHIEVVCAMRYGKPGLSAVFSQLKQKGCEQILVLPLFPQYAAATNASVVDATLEHYAHVRNVPELRFVKQYHDHEGYIHALAESIQTYWAMNGAGEKLVMSFHGLPERSRTLGDPYYDQCQNTAHLLARALHLSDGQYRVTFQSRFGRQQWLQPYTMQTLEQLAREGVEHVDIVCPGFTSDCLETIEEIALAGRSHFLMAGGKQFHYISCLNETSAWIAALADLAEQHLLGWPTMIAPEQRTPSAHPPAA